MYCQEAYGALLPCLPRGKKAYLLLITVELVPIEAPLWIQVTD